MRPTPTPGSPGRLTKGHQYRRVYKEGKLARGGLLWLYLLPTSDRRIRAGVSISRSVIKKAVTRNKLNRTIREWIRQHRSSAEGGYEVVVVVKKDTPITRANLKSTREELSRLLKKAITRPHSWHERTYNKSD